MRKPSVMHVASRMQNMLQIRAWNARFATKLSFGKHCNNSFGAIGVGCPHGGTITAPTGYQKSTQKKYTGERPQTINIVIIYQVLIAPHK